MRRRKLGRLVGADLDWFIIPIRKIAAWGLLGVVVAGAGFLGYRVWFFKWLVFVISAAIAGLAGALFAMAQQSAYPNVMSLQQSGFVVMMVLIGGGLISFWGPLIGAAFFILARDLLGAYTETWLFWYGLLFMALVLFKPEGLAGMGRDLMARFRSSRAR